MALRINDDAPNFTADTTAGPINFHEWIGDGWAILFSHPKDFTPVCTTELGYMAGLQPEFAKRNCKILGVSVDGVSDHEKWSKDIEASQGHAINYPLIGDPELKIVKLYDMLPADAGDTSEGRTPADNATARSVFVIGPDKKIKATLTYPMSTGRNFDEVLRLLGSCQLTATQKVATPRRPGGGRRTTKHTSSASWPGSLRRWTRSIARGQAEHGGQLWEAPGLLAELHAETFDLLAYGQAIEEHAGRIFRDFDAGRVTADAAMLQVRALLWGKAPAPLEGGEV